MRNRTYGGVRGRKVSLPCGKLTFLLLDVLIMLNFCSILLAVIGFATAVSRTDSGTYALTDGTLRQGASTQLLLYLPRCAALYQSAAVLMVTNKKRVPAMRGALMLC